MVYFDILSRIQKYTTRIVIIVACLSGFVEHAISNDASTNLAAVAHTPSIQPTMIPVTTISDEADRRAAFYTTMRQQKNPYQQMERYIQQSRIVTMHTDTKRDEITNVMRTALTKQIQDNGGKWPGSETLKVAEQFFLNLIYNDPEIHNNFAEYKQIIKSLFKEKITGNWDSYLNFCTLYTHRSDDFWAKKIMKDLLSTYLAFPHSSERQLFIEFCEPYMNEEHATIKVVIMNNILPIYQAFSNNHERHTFIDFCMPYTGKKQATDQTRLMSKLLPIYQAFPINDERRQDFMNFCEPYIDWHDSEGTIKNMNTFLPIYQTFSHESEREAFINFCIPHMARQAEATKIRIISSLFPIYQAFSNNYERHTFMNFFELYMKGEHATVKSIIINDFLPIYQAFSNDNERHTFMGFCTPYTDEKPAITKMRIMSELFPIYQAFPVDDEKRNAFIVFCAPYTGEKQTTAKTRLMKKLLPIYQAFPVNDEKRSAFMEFCRPYIDKENAEDKLKIMNDLLSIYKAPLQKQNFEAFMQIHWNKNIQIQKVLKTYFYRTYLRYIRVNSALNAESVNQNRAYFMYEINLDEQLMTLQVEDPFLQQARGVTNAVANAHEFDGIYEQDQDILWRLASAPAQSGITRTIYNNHEAPYNHQSNVEIDDFIHYLETEINHDAIHAGSLTGKKAVHIIKMILGLAPKDENTTGGFSPYLSASMYYAKPESPRGDEMLGRAWAFMKRMATEKGDNDFKKEIVFALLETAEISGARVDTHCQTRTSGELFKVLSWHLPDSKLKSLIATADLPPVLSNTDIQARIEAAPLRARDLFKRMKQEDSGEIRRLIERCIDENILQPELWQRYEAYYDDLYRRTKITDGTPYNENIHIQSPDGRMYRRDEHILMRDDHGNLVQAFNADGTTREHPSIIYYQSEFQVFEHAFTQLMKHEFEDQLELKY